MGRILTAVGILICVQVVQAQTTADSLIVKTEEFIQDILYQSHDTSYIENYSNELSLKLLGVFKYTGFNVFDKETRIGFSYRPDRQINLGFGIAYRWFAIDLAFNVGIREENVQDSDFLDFQGRIFSRKQYFEATYQYYYGYQLHKVKGIDVPPSTFEEFRDDIRTIKISLQYLYSFNYGKFSLQAPFVSNEVQKKSQGSFLGGFHFSQYTLDSDSSIVPLAQNQIDPNAQVNDLNVSTLGVYGGYMYSLVWRKFYVTASIIPSLNVNFGDYRVTQRERIQKPLSVGYRTMNAIGYNSRRFYMGLQLTLNNNRVAVGNSSRIGYRHGNAKYFFGWRFANKGSK